MAGHGARRALPAVQRGRVTMSIDFTDEGLTTSAATPVSVADPAVRLASNLDLDQRINGRLRRGEPVLHLGFGESRLPLNPGLIEHLSAGTGLTAYGPVAGRVGPREAVAGYFARRGLPTSAEDVVLSPGSKPLLLAIIAAVPGDVILSRPAWVTYEPQASLLGRRVIRVPIPPKIGGVPDPDLLLAAIAGARAQGANPRILILTSPDNPTGTTADPATIHRLANVAEQEDLVIVFDEIYRDVIFDQAVRYLSPAQLVEHRTVVVTGLSKSLALGGWRIGAARFSSDSHGRLIRKRVIGAASQMWSNAPGPMQAVAEYAFAEPADLVAHREQSTRLHGAVAVAAHGAFRAAGARVRVPTGGFYVYPDFRPLARPLASLGVTDSASLEHFLLETMGIAVLGGHHCGDDPRALRFRAATSLLYGSTDEERWHTLRAADPTALPHIATALQRIASIGPRIAELAALP